MDSRKLRERRCIAVCMGGDCKEKGSRKLFKKLGKALEKAGKAGETRLCKGECMGVCGKGPHVQIYPEGPWYYGVEPDDAEKIAGALGKD